MPAHRSKKKKKYQYVLTESEKAKKPKSEFRVQTPGTVKLTTAGRTSSHGLSKKKRKIPYPMKLTKLMSCVCGYHANSWLLDPYPTMPISWYCRETNLNLTASRASNIIVSAFITTWI